MWCSVPGIWGCSPGMLKLTHTLLPGLGRLKGAEVGTSQGRDLGLAPTSELKADALSASQVFHVAALLNPLLDTSNPRIAEWTLERLPPHPDISWRGGTRRGRGGGQRGHSYCAKSHCKHSNKNMSFSKAGSCSTSSCLGVGRDWRYRGGLPPRAVYLGKNLFWGSPNLTVFQELGIIQQKEACKKPFPKELTHLGRKHYSMLKRNTLSRASGCEVTEGGWEVTGADFPKVAQMPH